MKDCKLNLVAILLAAGILVPAAFAQKPPAPAPAPTPRPPTQPSNGVPSNSQPTQPGIQQDLVQFLHGRVATSDGTSLPYDAVVERVCNSRVLQQVYATSRGDFTMQLGSRGDPFVDASGSPSTQENTSKNSSTESGIPRHELANCELRASVAGFRSDTLSLVDLPPSDVSVDVGAIIVKRLAKVKGATLSAAPYQAPPNARKAYEKGLQADRKGQLTEAHKYLQQALDIYPRYASAWFHMGLVLEKEKQKDSAREAFNHAATIDPKFLPPFVSLAGLAYQERNWTDVLQLSAHVIDLDPSSGAIGGYVLDLDELNPAAAYFYNAFANYSLNRMEEAEKSGLKAEHLDMRTNFPQLHLLLADVFARKSNYADAISETQRYLELAPHAKNRDEVQQRLAKYEALKRSSASNEKPVHN